MSDDKLVAPDDSSLVQGQPSDGLSGAIVEHIEDDIADGRTLRAWRPWIAGALLAVAALFYLALLAVIVGLAVCCNFAYLASQTPTVIITVIVVLAAVPTLIAMGVSKAVFGKRTNAESPYTPLQAIIHLMKELKGN